MIRFIAGSTFALLAATSVQAMTPAPIPRPDGVITQVAFGCGIGRTLVNGQCVARVVIRQGDYTQGYHAQGYYTEPHYSPYNHYVDVTGQPWDAVRAYYAGGPWYIGSNGWDDYAARYGIVCTPGTLIKGGDNVMYVCQ